MPCVPCVFGPTLDAGARNKDGGVSINRAWRGREEGGTVMNLAKRGGTEREARKR